MRLRAETRAAIEAATAAGWILADYARRRRASRVKASGEPVTAADRAAERCVRRLLARQFPRVGFLGEEGTAASGPDGRWLVDPLDGTIAFLAGLPSFGVSIALERQGTIEAGVILLPRLRELFVAERGGGAWLNERRMRVSRTANLARAVVSLWPGQAVWGHRSVRNRLAGLARRVRGITIFGAVFSLAYVAAGRLDGYWERNANPWDVAAGSLLVREAGGRITDETGAPFALEQPTVVASNGRIHARLVALLSGRAIRGRS